MHSLSPYTMRIFDRKLPGPSGQKYHALNKVRGKDLLKIIQQFTKNNSKNYHELVDEKTQKVLKFSNVTVKKRTIYGLLEYGEYGIKGKVVNVTSGNTVYSKKKDDSDVHLLYFNFTIPTEETTGVCLFHKIHGRGVKGLVDKLLNEFFKMELDGLRIQINPLTYEKAVKEWLEKSKVKEIRLMKYKPKLDASDQIDQMADNHVEIRYKSKDGSFGKYFDFGVFKNKKGVNNQAVTVLSQYCSSVKAVVDLDGKKRVFSLTSNGLPSSSIEFDDEDVLMDDGAPELSSLHVFSQKLIDDILTTL